VDQTATYYGGFFSEATCHAALGGNATGISKGESKVTVYYDNAYPTAVTVHATGSGLINVVDWQPTLAAKAIKNLGFGPDTGATGINTDGSYASGQCVGPFNLMASDVGFTALVLGMSDTTYAITYVSGDAKVYPDSSCGSGQELTHWKMPGGAW